MIYLQTETLIIRNMELADASVIAAGERAQGWLNASEEKYLRRLNDQAEGRATALTAVYHGEAVGYVNVYPNSVWGAFGGRGLPEIVDFGVLEKYQRHGIGSALMDIAEQIAAQYADSVYLGVGLHAGYGSAQRMYVKRGYIPDGTGVWYQDAIAGMYTAVNNDDDLVLYLSKKLK